jgi:hypothetical protein
MYGAATAVIAISRTISAVIVIANIPDRFMAGP